MSLRVLLEQNKCKDRERSPGGSREKLHVVSSSGLFNRYFVKGVIHPKCSIFLLILYFQK